MGHGWFGWCLVLAVASVAAGDEVFLAGGSKLVGAIQGLSKEGLTVQTEFGGAMRIDASKVLGISADRNLVVAMKAGERVTGVLKYSAERGQVLTGTAFGDVPVKVDQMVAIWAPGAVEAQGAAPGEAQAAELAAIKKKYDEEVAAREKRKGRWTAQLELGLDGQSGNTDRLAFRGRAETRYATDAERLLLYTQGRYVEEEQVRSVNEILGGATLEVDVSPRWFAFGKITGEIDEFENLDLRATVAAGMGYFFIRQPDQELKGRFGFGARHESYTDGTDANSAMVELGVDAFKDIAPWLKLTHSTTFSPALDDFADYRISSESGVVVPLGKVDSPWKLKAGVRFEYDSLPQPGIDELDIYYFVSLVYDLLK